MARRKKKKLLDRWWVKFFVIAAAIVLIAETGLKIWQSDAVQTRFVYMWPYQKEILEYSSKNKIDPFLVAAVIKNESGFDSEALSQAGAVGLMQIMPETGEWIAAQMGLDGFNTKLLRTPEYNVRLGCWYLGELEYEFQRNWVLMMIAYNAGRGNTREWMQSNGWTYDFNRIEDIPYPDTREYVKKG